jgi:hypothetical protein
MYHGDFQILKSIALVVHWNVGEYFFSTLPFLNQYSMQG